MKKLSTRWVPQLLTLEHKCTRVEMSEQSLTHFQRNQQDFLRWFVTTDETWVHHYTSETKQQSSFQRAESPQSKKAKTVRSAGKVMASVFWDAKAILLIDYLPTGQTIMGQYYTNLLEQLQEKICAKNPGLARKNSSFIRPMLAYTQVLLPWQKSMNYGTNCCLICLIWHHQTFIYFPSWKFSSVDIDFLQRKYWQPKWRSILQTWRNLIFGQGIVTALVYRETMLKYKNSSTKARHLVHSENLSNHPRIVLQTDFYNSLTF